MRLVIISLSLQQKVEDLIKRVDAQDQKIQYLEKYKEKSKQTIIKKCIAKLLYKKEH